MKLNAMDVAYLLFRHPGSVVRRIRGLDPSGFSLEEIASELDDDVQFILEAGTASGQDTALMLEHWPMAKLCGAEPVPELRQTAVLRCKDFTERVHIHDFALTGGGAPSEVSLHISRTRDGVHESASILKPTEVTRRFPELEFTETRLVPGRSLTDLFAISRFPRVDLLWLDIQGAELEVLRAAASTVLPLTRAIYTEISRTPGDEGSPTYSETHDFLTSVGFSLVMRRVPIFFGNALYVRTDPSYSRIATRRRGRRR